MKKVIALVLTIVMVMTLAACGGSGSGSAKTEKKLFGYICMDLTNPFHIAMRDELKALA